MMIIGVDYHPSFQTIAFLMEETGECGDQELNHGDGQAERFYRDLQQRGIRGRVGMEATGYSRWFERLLSENGASQELGSCDMDRRLPSPLRAYSSREGGWPRTQASPAKGTSRTSHLSKQFAV
jgi:hypothetical protein